MLTEYTFRHRIAFHETDMAGIVHFSNYFRWMEMGEHALLASIDFPAVKKDGATFWGWPRVRASCDYSEPIRYADEILCRVFIKEIKIKAVVYFFRFFKKTDDRGFVPVAKGEMTSVYAKFDVKEGDMRAIDLEAALLSKIKEASADSMKSRELKP
ncbi:acyl-CoA thioesterase [Puniceicoccaceae bacterium K14]|nr:acyl-CoA thioesterase [Puniceicoccaceae bacterium K14]